jgi:hypothetical protein
MRGASLGTRLSFASPSRPAIASVGPSTRLHVTFRWTKKFVYFPCGVSKPSALQERLRDTALR